MDQKGDITHEDLKTVQRGMEEAAKKVAHTTQSDRQKR